MNRRTFFSFFTTALAGLGAVLALPRKKPLVMGWRKIEHGRRKYYYYTENTQSGALWKFVSANSNGVSYHFNDPNIAIQHLMAGHKCWRINRTTGTFTELLPPHNDLPPWLMNRQFHL